MQFVGVPLIVCIKSVAFILLGISLIQHPFLFFVSDSTFYFMVIEYMNEWMKTNAY